jgi:hypothetical protein
MTEHDDAHEIVRALLAAARIPASEEEIDRLTDLYRDQQKSIALLYGVEEARYESPALTFNPTPVFAEWSDGQS